MHQLQTLLRHVDYEVQELNTCTTLNRENQTDQIIYAAYTTNRREHETSDWAKALGATASQGFPALQMIARMKVQVIVV